MALLFYLQTENICKLQSLRLSKHLLIIACCILVFPSLGLASPVKKLPSLQIEPGSAAELVSRMIVKPSPQADGKFMAELSSRDVSSLSKLISVPLTILRPMSGGAHVVQLNQPVSLPEAKVIAAELMRDPRIELAEPDRIMHPSAFTPNDPLYSKQWNLMAASPTNPGGANLPDAWSITRGAPSVTIAVLDTGYRPHEDLVQVLPGYDFISDIQTANDGNGRDADAQDPGDWTLANECSKNSPAQPSDWHGTHVTGIIAATLNNNLGVAGIAPDIRVLPVRVLGKCGGYTSDIVDGMRWAAGLAVNGVPDNPNPAKVLNLSLGASGTCSATFQSAISEILHADRTIVVAAGNDGNAQVDEPANCNGVIAVTAHAADGDNSDYANVGPEITISAPGGGCGTTASANNTCSPLQSSGIYSLLNSGTKGPGSDSYHAYAGTSMATPHVTGVAALMLSLDPALTHSQIRSYLQSSARSFPQNTYCTRHTGLCGTGLLDASQALGAVTAPPPTVTLDDIPGAVPPGEIVALSGNAVPGNGRSIVSYAWSQLTGTFPLNLSPAGSQNASFTAPATGTYSIMLTATDNGGDRGSATAVVHVNSPPALQFIPAQTVTAGQNLDFSLHATDIDGDVPVFHGVTLPAGATLSPAGEFSWPNPSPAGTYQLTYYASDNYADSPLGTIAITVLTGPSASQPSGGTGSFDGKTLLALSLLSLAALLVKLVRKAP